MRVLVINCGSSSVKYQLLAMDREALLAGGIIERIGEGMGRIRHREGDEQGNAHSVWERSVEVPDHRVALSLVNDVLMKSDLLVEGLTAIGHRVVHGGECFSSAVLIDATVIATIRALIPLAPLHNPANLAGIEACTAAFPGVPQVAVFDTAFHQTMPPSAYRYAIPTDWYRRYHVRRYGFHGTSHAYVARCAAEYLHRPLETLKLITLHLGNGASAAALAQGRCVDTSMGFTPLEGLVMGTRCGDLDAAIPLYIQRQEGGASVEAIEHALNHEAGLRALAGSNDVRDLLVRQARGDGDAQLALDLYCYRIKKYVGAYFAVLGGVDAVVFTGGVGENAAIIRLQALQGLECLGIKVDAAANLADQAGMRDISSADASVRVLVIPTREELQIARETLSLVRALSG